MKKKLYLSVNFVNLKPIVKEEYDFIEGGNIRKTLNVTCVVKFFTVKVNVGSTENITQLQPN